VKGDRTGVRALAGLCALSLAAVAEASPGNGIRLGGSEGRLHPYLELEGRYDSNLAFTDQAQQQSGFILHVRPGLTLDSPGQNVAVNLLADLDWAQYFGDNSDLSRLYGHASLGVGVNRRGTLGLELTDAFARDTSTQALTIGYATVQNTNDLRVSVPYRPGGGAFVTTLTGGWQLTSYEPFFKGSLCTTNPGPQCDPAQLSQLNYSDYSGMLDVRWKFLPRTAAVGQGEYWRRVTKNSAPGSEGSGFRAWVGMAGLFSTHLAGTVKGGWGGADFSPTQTSTWLANVEGEWLPTETAGLKLGYLHDVDADPGTDGVYVIHRGYVDGRMLLSGRYSGLLTGSYDHRDYAGTGVLQVADLFTITPSVEAEVSRWLRAGLGVAYTKRTSQLAPGTAALPGYDYGKTEVFLRFRGTY
jgi:hypothetical protein